jgi:hypothetical protein
MASLLAAYRLIGLPFRTSTEPVLGLISVRVEKATRFTFPHQDAPTYTA